MSIHLGKRLFVLAAVLGAAAVFATGFFVALGVRSVVAGPDSAPLALPPNPGHSWSEIGDLPGTMWHSNNDGAGSGLHADLLDGQQGYYYLNASYINAGTLSPSFYSARSDLTAEGHLGNAYGDLAQNNGIVQTSLNADTLDGYHYYQIHDADNYVSNADMVDGLHADQIHDADNYVSNADMVDGLHASDLTDDLYCTQWSSSGTCGGGVCCLGVDIGAGYYLTGGGCFDTGDVAKRLIYRNVPIDSNTWYCCTTDHVYASGGTIYVYALGCRVD